MSRDTVYGSRSNSNKTSTSCYSSSVSQKYFIASIFSFIFFSTTPFFFVFYTLSSIIYPSPILLSYIYYFVCLITSFCYGNFYATPLIVSFDFFVYFLLLSLICYVPSSNLSSVLLLFSSIMFSSLSLSLWHFTFSNALCLPFFTLSYICYFICSITSFCYGNFYATPLIVSFDFFVYFLLLSLICYVPSSNLSSVLLLFSSIMFSSPSLSS